MAITTYATLKTALETWQARSGDSVFTGEVDTFIDLAEARINRALIGDSRMEKNTTLTTDSNGEVSLPSDFLAVRFAYWDAATDSPLDVVSWEQLKRLNVTDSSGVPCRFAIQNTTLKLGPIKAGDVDFNYYAKITPLDGTNTTNWLLTLAPDVYFYLSLACSYTLVENEQKAALYERLGMSLLGEVKEQGDMAQYMNAGISLPGAVA